MWMHFVQTFPNEDGFKGQTNNYPAYFVETLKMEKKVEKVVNIFLIKKVLKKQMVQHILLQH
jgi:hypothetical protein